MLRYRVRYHRAILDERGRVMFPSGAVIDDISLIPAGQVDRILVFDDARPETVSLNPGIAIKIAKEGFEEDDHAEGSF